MASVFVAICILIGQRISAVSLRGLDDLPRTPAAIDWIEASVANRTTRGSLQLVSQWAEGMGSGRVPYTVWSFGEMPADASEFFRKAVEMWGSPGGCVWHMEAVEALLEKHLEWKTIWPQLTRQVMKSDLARYIVAYEVGGIYTDYDVKVNGPPPDKDWSLLLQVEKTLHSVEDFGKDAVAGREKPYLQRIAQYFFAAKPRHDFFRKVLDLAYGRVSKLLADPGKKVRDKDVLWATGPDVMTTVYHDHFHDDPTVILGHEAFFCKHMSMGRWKGGKNTTRVVMAKRGPSI